MGAIPTRPFCSRPNHPDPRRFSVNSGFPVASGQKFRGEHENDALMVLNRLSLKIRLKAERFVSISSCHHIFRLVA